MARHVVVVGAGVIGAACAYFLVEAGARVTLLDRGAVGGGTSSRCDGNVLAIDKSPGYDAAMAAQSQRLLAGMVAVLGDIEYRSPGSYLVCDNEDEVAPARRWVEQQRDGGLAFSYLDRAAVHAALPDLAEDVPAGLYCACDASLNPLLYVARMAEWVAQRAGAVMPHTPVVAVDTVAGRATGVRLQGGGRIGADAVVVACGVWTAPLLAPFGIVAPIRPRKGHLLVSARGPRFGDAKVMEFGYLMSKFGLERRVDPELERYGVALVYEPTRSGNFLLGSSREFVGETADVDACVMAAIARRGTRFYPGMRHATAIRAYTGLRPFTPDHMPIVARAGVVAGLYVAAGHEGDGIGLAAVTGALVRDMVFDRPPAIDPTPLRLERFATA